jgi:hypothetical protein
VEHLLRQPGLQEQVSGLQLQTAAILTQIPTFTDLCLLLLLLLATLGSSLWHLCYTSVGYSLPSAIHPLEHPLEHPLDPLHQVGMRDDLGRTPIQYAAMRGFAKVSTLSKCSQCHEGLR